MKDEILANLDNPKQLEKLFRENKATFRHEFQALYPAMKDHALIRFWHERLTFSNEAVDWGNRNELAFVIVLAIIAGFIAKIPSIFSIDQEFFYLRNIGFIVFPALAAYFAWKNKLSIGKIATVILLFSVCIIFINSVPTDKSSDTFILACLHLILLLWFVLGFSFVGDWKNKLKKRLHYLRCNGELIVMSTLIVIAGGIMSAITINLFLLIGLIGKNIIDFYVNNIVIIGVAAVPITATFLTQTNPQLVGKVSPVIARIFSPLVLVMLVSYLVAMIFSQKDPYTDREFLLIFNALLVGVMAIIFFSIAEASNTYRSRAEIWVLFLLSVVTIIVNGIALSAILFRISEWGITPNRAAVLGANGLMLVHLVWVAAQLFKVVTKSATLNSVGEVIARYLPVYFIWAAIVTFLFPFLFGFT